MNQPLFAVLSKNGWLKADEPLSLTHKENRVLELEIGFIVGEDILEPVTYTESLKTKIAAIVPVVEMPVNRIDKKGKLEFIDHIAANVGSDQYIVGKAFPKGVDPDKLKMSLFKDGKELTSATGSVADGGQWENHKTHAKGTAPKSSPFLLYSVNCLRIKILKKPWDFK